MQKLIAVSLAVIIAFVGFSLIGSVSAVDHEVISGTGTIEPSADFSTITMSIEFDVTDMFGSLRLDIDDDGDGNITQAEVDAMFGDDGDDESDEDDVALLDGAAPVSMTDTETIDGLVGPTDSTAAVSMTMSMVLTFAVDVTDSHLLTFPPEPVDDDNETDASSSDDEPTFDVDLSIIAPTGWKITDLDGTPKDVSTLVIDFSLVETGFNVTFGKDTSDGSSLGWSPFVIGLTFIGIFGAVFILGRRD